MMDKYKTMPLSSLVSKENWHVKIKKSNGREFLGELCLINYDLKENSPNEFYVVPYSKIELDFFRKNPFLGKVQEGDKIHFFASNEKVQIEETFWSKVFDKPQNFFKLVEI